MMPLSRIFAVILLSLLSGKSTWAQINLVPIAKKAESLNSVARTEGITLSLPLWEDFSATTADYPNENTWIAGKSVWVNSGMGINPPSLNVATFDGLDSLGKPYSVNDVLAKGFADKLISHPINLAGISPSLRPTVYISFFYQFQGNGEVPDPGDILSLSFKTSTGVWETVWSIENDGTLQKDVFVQILIPVSDSKFFHDKFQFRFQNFARLSGPFDTWNVDYIYLNSGRSSFDNSFPDRSVISPLTHLFGDYSSIPYKHFLNSPSSIFTNPAFGIYNLRIGNIQPLNYFSNAEVKSYTAGVASTQALALDNAQDIGALSGLQKKTATLQTIPPVNIYPANADSIYINLKLKLTTKDNELISNNGDYDPAIYSPVDFRSNDNLESLSKMVNYYAYDDGTAEYGASLGLPGAQLAYRFDMKTTKEDTLVAVKIYFPRFGEETNQVVRLQVWNVVNEKPGTLLYQENITVNRSEKNNFKTYPLSTFIGVKEKFFIGWKQNSATTIPVGLDKSSDSGSKVFFNTTGEWEQNTTVKGSLMIRPVFGKGKDSQTGVEKNNSFAYPNPSEGILRLPGKSEKVRIVDVMGRPVNCNTSLMNDEVVVTLTDSVSGLFILIYELNGRTLKEKILVKN